MDATETKIYEGILIASVVIGIILLYFIILFMRQQHINQALRKKNMLNEIAGLEKERGRIAADLHDELGPILSYVKMCISSFDLPDEYDREQRQNAQDQLDNVMRKIREISYDLMQDTLIKKGLIMGLREYIGFLKHVNDIRFTFSAPEHIEMSEDRSVNIYRIVQELLYNAIKHAKASEIEIEIRKKRSVLMVKVADNGTGFDYKQKAAERTGIGLRSLANRTRLADGKMFVKSGPAIGSVFMFEMPF
jgi:signal transduction histidine kinase